MQLISNKNDSLHRILSGASMINKNNYINNVFSFNSQ